MIVAGDLFDVLPTLPEACADACVTDPPYELGFMGKAWDGRGVAFQVDTWRQVSRVLKPGAHLVAFGGTRTFHRLTCAIEDAGFEIRDCLSWLYGQGFPKSLNVGGGRGTALKPSWEPIILARKPFRGCVVANVIEHGTAALNIDACRIEGDKRDPGFVSPNSKGIWGGAEQQRDWADADLGRWPSNVLLDEEAAAMLDEQTGKLHPNGNLTNKTAQGGIWNNAKGQGCAGPAYFDNGGASRFYYVAKPSREERNYGLDDPGPQFTHGATLRKIENTSTRGNIHPTVKPVELMRWLVKLVTPPGGAVLDPFAGSGTTGMACRYELRSFMGIEREAEYVEIAIRRIAACVPLFDGEAHGTGGT